MALGELHGDPRAHLEEGKGKPHLSVLYLRNPEGHLK